MTTFAGSIKRGLSGLARFSGRDTRRQFWSYVGFLTGLWFVGFSVAMAMLMNTLFDRMARFAAEHPDQVTVTSSPGHYSMRIHGTHPELMPDITLMFAIMGSGIAIVVALLAAAVTRRLHDRGMRGFWGLLPVPFLATAVVAFPKLVGRMQDGTAGLETMRLFTLLFLNNIAYIVALVTLVVLLAKRSDPGSNRFGPPAA